MSGFGDSIKSAFGRQMKEALQPPAKKQVKQAERGARLAMTVNLTSSQMNEAITVNQRTAEINEWGALVAINLNTALVIVTSPTPVDEASVRAKMAAMRSQQQPQQTT